MNDNNRPRSVRLDFSQSLASERAGVYFHRVGDNGMMEQLQDYLEQAVGLYGDWGATAKVDQLFETYPMLLSGMDSSVTGISHTTMRGQPRYSTEATSKHERFDPFQFETRRSVFGMGIRRQDSGIVLALRPAGA
uniref:Uncharacterized protein n=1 Tax=Cyclophora tenuis TaxID=216820 RepID=A0A7S1CWM8_CYCTE|mmetsp:Transcript_10312/g.17310  ORF Transcript_10312/g.17310 Transcript_10312/m.17310 type:complete len:135 (+) Transcript_10312:752-1156(+)